MHALLYIALCSPAGPDMDMGPFPETQRIISITQPSLQPSIVIVDVNPFLMEFNIPLLYSFKVQDLFNI